MEKRKSLEIVAVIITGIAISLIILKWRMGYFQTENYSSGLNYKLKYSFDLKGGLNDNVFVKALLPQSNDRQQILDENQEIHSFIYSESIHNKNRIGEWQGISNGSKENIEIDFNLHVEPVKYEIDDQLTLSAIKDASAIEVQPSKYIEAQDPKIKSLGEEIKGNSTMAGEVINAIFNHVYEIPTQSINELMTASETLERNAASCNGKSRLFVALCRGLDIPSRVVGGIILNEENKKTSHLWAEVLINDDWVPFDALNGYYAYLPVNYLEIYRGDEFLLKRSKNMLFDYSYSVALNKDENGFLGSFNMFNIANKAGISSKVMSLLMLLPLGALIVAIFRNVIGVKTFGVFLPVLIAISFLSTGLIFGIASFVCVLLLISCLHFPLLKWGILHVPKLVVMLSAVVFLMIIVLYAGLQFNLTMVSGLTLFPIVILTISAEKYSKIVVEEGVLNATKILGQTLLVTLFCYAIVSSEMIYLLLMNFPELLLLISVVSLLLGKWIGLRVSEYQRFNFLIS